MIVFDLEIKTTVYSSKTCHGSLYLFSGCSGYLCQSHSGDSILNIDIHRNSQSYIADVSQRRNVIKLDFTSSDTDVSCMEIPFFYGVCVSCYSGLYVMWLTCLGDRGKADCGTQAERTWSRGPAGSVPRRSFGSFPIAGKGTRPAGRNPFRHPTAGTREGRPLIRHGMRRDTFPPEGEGFGENGTPPDRGTGLCRRACFTENCCL